MEKKFNSMTEEVRELINQFMATVTGDCERKAIVTYVKENIGNAEQLTDGVVAGAIKQMVANNELMVVNRATYRKGVKIDSLSLKEKVVALLEGFQKDLSKVCTVNLMEVDDGEIEYIKKVHEISNRLEVEIWGLEDTEDKKETATADNKKADKKDNKATLV